jgi:aspartate/methionine/tyrosine aminotransferase
MSDTFLAVGEIQQALIPAILAAGDPNVSAALSAEIGIRRQVALDALTTPPPSPQGGIYLCCRLPEGVDDEALALTLLREHQVLVHPGHFYDLSQHTVLTCLARPAMLRSGIEHLNSFLQDGQVRGG